MFVFVFKSPSATLVTHKTAGGRKKTQVKNAKQNFNRGDKSGLRKWMIMHWKEERKCALIFDNRWIIKWGTYENRKTSAETEKERETHYLVYLLSWITRWLSDIFLLNNLAYSTRYITFLRVVISWTSHISAFAMKCPRLLAIKWTAPEVAHFMIRAAYKPPFHEVVCCECKWSIFMVTQLQWYNI